MAVYDFDVKAISKGTFSSSGVHQSYWGSSVIRKLKPNKILNNNGNIQGFILMTINKSIKLLS